MPANVFREETRNSHPYWFAHPGKMLILLSRLPNVRNVLLLGLMVTPAATLVAATTPTVAVKVCGPIVVIGLAKSPNVNKMSVVPATLGSTRNMGDGGVLINVILPGFVNKADISEIPPVIDAVGITVIVPVVADVVDIPISSEGLAAFCTSTTAMHLPWVELPEKFAVTINEPAFTLSVK